MKNFFVFVAYTAVLILFLDLMILAVSIAQVAVGQPTGEWSQFWLWQAQLIGGIMR